MLIKEQLACYYFFNKGSFCQNIQSSSSHVKKIPKISPDSTLPLTLNKQAKLKWRQNWDWLYTCTVSQLTLSHPTVETNQWNPNITDKLIFHSPSQKNACIWQRLGSILTYSVLRTIQCTVYWFSELGTVLEGVLNLYIKCFQNVHLHPPVCIVGANAVAAWGTAPAHGQSSVNMLCSTGLGGAIKASDLKTIPDPACVVAALASLTHTIQLFK